MAVTGQLQGLLNRVNLRPRRLSLATPGVHATVPMLRGVWGAALHDLDAGLYTAVFEGVGPASARVPLFVLRPAPPDPEDAPAADWILINGAHADDERLIRAWHLAVGRGLGPHRTPFVLRAVRRLDPAGRPLPDAAAADWRLGEATWPLDGDPATTPCRLAFAAPLRLLRYGRLIERPTLADIVASGLRRVSVFLPRSAVETLAALRPALVEIARLTPASPWQGRRLDLVRYSGRQESEVEMRGVAGELDLPQGPGSLWPLLIALAWIHVGKGTVVGMGQPTIEPP